MEIILLHEAVFQFLMEERKKTPDLYFTLRGINDDKLKKGYWFDNSFNAVRFSFWEGFDGVSKASRVAIHIDLDGNLFVYLNAQDSNDYADVFRIIAKASGGKFTQYTKFGKTENQWLRKYEANDWENNLRQFINSDMLLIVGMLEIAKPNIKDTVSVSRIDEATFERKYYGRIKVARQDFFRDLEQERIQEEKRRQKEEEDRQEEERKQEEERRRKEEEPKQVKTLKLTSVHLENIGHFEKIDIENLKQVNILIGENGIGKSTILKAIALAITGVNVFQPEGEDINKFSLKDEDLTNFLQILDVHEGKTTYKQKASIQLKYILGHQEPEKTNFQILDAQEFENKIIWEKDEKDRFARAYDESNFRTFATRKVMVKNEIKEETHLASLVIALPQGGGFSKEEPNFTEDTSPDPHSLLYLIKDLSIHKIEGIQKWIAANYSIANDKPETDSWRKGVIDKLFQIISKIVSEDNNENFVSLKEVYRDQNTDKASIIVKTTTNQGGIDLRMISQGYQNLFYWIGNILSALSCFKSYAIKQSSMDYEKYVHLEITQIPAIVLIDEIDTYLHPNWQYNIFKVLVETFENIQFIATTHSPAVLTSLSKDIDHLIFDVSAKESLNSIYYGSRMDLVYYSISSERIKKAKKDFKSLLAMLDSSQNLKDFENVSDEILKMKNIYDPNDPDILYAEQMLQTKKMLLEYDAN